VVDIAATAFLWIEHMEYDQYRPVLPFDMLLVTIHVLLYWQMNSLHLTNGYTLPLTLFGHLPLHYGTSATTNYMDIKDNSHSKPSANSLLPRQQLFIMTPLIWSTGPNNTLMPTLPQLKWLVNGMSSLVRIYLSCAAWMYGAWGGSHMVCEISLVLIGDFEVSVTNKMNKQ
jgi:hypothetical protein